MPLHHVLARQIRKSFMDGDAPSSVGFQHFVELISGSYEGFDEDRRLIERSLELSSKELGESERKYRTVFENSPIGIYSVSTQGTIDYANPKFLEISGAPLEKIIGLNIYNLPTYIDSGLGEKIKAIFQGSSFETDLDYTSFIGHKRSFRRYRGVPIYSSGDEKQVERALLLVEDITESKEAEEKLKVFASLSDTDPNPVVRLSKDLIITIANASAARYFNQVRLVGRRWPDVCPGTEEALLESLNNHGVYRQELHFGDLFFDLIYRKVDIYDAIHIYGFDVTDRKKAEQELRNKTEELEKMNKLMVGRELKMVELKREIDKLKEQMNHLEKVER